MASSKPKPKDLKRKKSETPEPYSLSGSRDQISSDHTKNKTGLKDSDVNSGEDISESYIVPIILSVEESEEVLTMTIQEMERFKEKFDLHMETDLMDAVLMDYYVTAAYWAQRQKYSSTQLSEFFTLVCTLIQKVIDNHISLVDLMKDFRCMLSSIGTDVKVENDSLKVFSTKEGKEIVSYFSTGLFQHLKLYQYMFSRSQSEELISCELSVELPLPAHTPFPPYLDEGMPANVLSECAGIPTPPSEASEDGTVGQSDNISLPEIKDIFTKLRPEDVKKIISQVSANVLDKMQVDIEAKMKAQEDNFLKKI